MSFIEWLAPLKSIASSLRIIAELYELELESKQIYRKTEKPKDSDTTVSYSHEDDAPVRSVNSAEKWFRAIDPDYDPEAAKEETRG